MKVETKGDIMAMSVILRKGHQVLSPKYFKYMFKELENKSMILLLYFEPQWSNYKRII